MPYIPRYHVLQNQKLLNDVIFTFHEKIVKKFDIFVRFQVFWIHLCYFYGDVCMCACLCVWVCVCVCMCVCVYVSQHDSV